MLGRLLGASAVALAGGLAAWSVAAAGAAADQELIELMKRGVDSDSGADVIVGDLNGVRLWGTSGDITAYSVGTTSCNVGDTPLLWESENTNHPVIGQNMYRHKDGRLTQIGQSWLKHGFFALAQNLCDNCEDPGSGALLGVGCSDPYGSSLNGSQGGLGPRFEVNATTGEFLYPYFGQNQVGSTIYKRLQVQTDDVRPSDNAGASYFVEGHYITPDDAQAGNGTNNASWREITISSNLQASFAGPTQRMEAAIHAWKMLEPSVEIVKVTVPQDGQFTVAAKVEENADGTWRYEYAVHNLNSHRSAKGFVVPISPGTKITNIGFHDVPYHSGEPFDSNDWFAKVEVKSVAWRISDLFHDGFESGNAEAWGLQEQELGANVNALRWGTMYNFWFDADRGPALGNGTIELYRSGIPAEMNLRILSPQ